MAQFSNNLAAAGCFAVAANIDGRVLVRKRNGETTSRNVLLRKNLSPFPVILLDVLVGRGQHLAVVVGDLAVPLVDVEQVLDRGKRVEYVQGRVVVQESTRISSRRCSCSTTLSSLETVCRLPPDEI